jgi:peptide/nickel transport system permease protein
LKIFYHQIASHWLGGKLLRLLAVVLAVSVLTFLMLAVLPGDAAYQIAGTEATAEDIDTIREELGLNRPLPLRYANWLAQVLSGNLGDSFRTGESVRDAILSRLPVTLELMVLAPIFALCLAVPAAILSAHRAQSGLDRGLSTLAFASMSVPHFVMALLLIYFFALQLCWLPATGFVPLEAGLAANLQSVALPVVSLALVEWVPLMRVLRSDLIGTLQEDYILMARSKGLSPIYILLRHALRPSLFTLTTVLGLHLGHLIGGALIVEHIFALPGMGRLLITAIFARDTFLVQGCILFITVGYVLINFCVDLLYLLLDPRLRSQNGRETP